MIKQIVESKRVSIPILGSGDMLSPCDIAQFLHFTGANGVLVARGSIHNPGLFKHKAKILSAASSFQDLSIGPELAKIWAENT